MGNGLFVDHGKNGAGGVSWDTASRDATGVSAGMMFFIVHQITSYTSISFPGFVTRAAQKYGRIV